MTLVEKHFTTSRYSFGFGVDVTKDDTAIQAVFVRKNESPMVARRIGWGWDNSDTPLSIKPKLLRLTTQGGNPETIFIWCGFFVSKIYDKRRK